MLRDCESEPTFGIGTEYLIGCTKVNGMTAMTGLE